MKTVLEVEQSAIIRMVAEGLYKRLDAVFVEFYPIYSAKGLTDLQILLR